MAHEPAPLAAPAAPHHPYGVWWSGAGSVSTCRALAGACGAHIPNSFKPCRSVRALRSNKKNLIALVEQRNLLAGAPGVWNTGKGGSKGGGNPYPCPQGPLSGFFCSSPARQPTSLVTVGETRAGIGWRGYGAIKTRINLDLCCFVETKTNKDKHA